MARKKVKFGLSVAEIDRAIKEIDEFKNEIIKKTETLKEKIAEYIRSSASFGFIGANADDIIGGRKYADVNVTVEKDGDVLIVIARGKDAVWVEFGAGVYHNGSVGSTPNPLGKKFDFRIGEYGMKMGRRKTWAFKDETGEVRLTHGTPANMPMYRALEAAINDFRKIVKEVWKQ